MDGSHDEVSLDDLYGRQRDIDGLIDSLLKFVPTSTNTATQQRRGSIGNVSSVTSNSPSSQTNKGRGRPRRTQTSVVVPPPSPAPSGSSVVSLETIVECLNKINDQNKKLLNFVDVLAHKVERNTITESTPVPQSADPLPIEQKAVLEGVNDRLERIEQNLNSNTLICRGPAIERLVNETATGESANLERLKGKVCEAVCGDEVTSVDVNDLQVSLFGRDRKSVRLNCTKLASKIHLLKQARRKRPDGIYINEFLTSSKLNIYKSLRQLKARHPHNIKAAFTRNGNIFYIPGGSNQVIHVSSLADLNNIVIPSPERSADNSSASSSTD